MNRREIQWWIGCSAGDVKTVAAKRLLLIAPRLWLASPAERPLHLQNLCQHQRDLIDRRSM
jgi:hypothetical protein